MKSQPQWPIHRTSAPSGHRDDNELLHMYFFIDSYEAICLTAKAWPYLDHASMSQSTAANNRMGEKEKSRVSK